MIFTVSEQFVHNNDERLLAEFFCEALCNGHFIDCPDPVHDFMDGCIERHASSLQKETAKAALSSNYLTDALRRHLTCINADLFNINDLRTMVDNPARILVENVTYESDVYKNMIGTYAHDRKFGAVFSHLNRAKHNQWILFVPSNSGFGGFQGVLDYTNRTDYKDVARYKICTIMDRDTDSATDYDNKKNGLFRLFCNKTSADITESDIYTLNMPNYVWHMWYKRAIENYFPNEQFEARGYDTSQFPADQAQRDYFKIDGNSSQRYSKDKLPTLTQGMSRDKYERGLKHFNVDGTDMSELQLLLLKFVKII